MATNTPIPPQGTYRCVFYRNKRGGMYTETRMNESDYLLTEVWAELRRKRLEKDFFRCAICGTAQNVIVHHIRYPDIWGTEDVDDDLITLCDRCHAEAHKNDIKKPHDSNRRAT